MGKETNSIVCSHSKGVACPICYDQIFGTGYKQAIITGTAPIGVDPATDPPTVTVYKHPFLNTDSID